MKGRWKCSLLLAVASWLCIGLERTSLHRLQQVWGEWGALPSLDLSSTPFNETQTNVCSLLSSTSASSLWRSNLENILNASIHPLDPERVHESWMKQLLELVSPAMMERGLASWPSSVDIQHIINIINRRLDDPMAPPLQVVVFGGSVAEGTKCDWVAEVLHVDTRAKPPIKGGICTWPFRLQLLADNLLGEGVVDVHNLAAGGTNSALALPALRYSLYPNSSLLDFGADVIINGYAVNDNYPGGTENATASLGMFEVALDRAQAFVREALSSKPCRRPPVVIFVDEYFGNQAHAEILLADQIRHTAVQAVSEHYRLAYIRPAQVVRHFVAADESEAVFSPQWYRSNGERGVDGHFGMSGHVHVALTIAYAALKLAVTSCASNQESSPRNNLLVSKDATALRSTPSLPPTLTKSLTLSQLPSFWHAASHAEQERLADYCAHTSDQSPCALAMVSTRAGNAPRASLMRAILEPFITHNTGWHAVDDLRHGWQNKAGLVPDHTAAVLELTLPQLHNPVRVLTVHWLKSYGEPWLDSRVRLDVTIVDATVTVHQKSLLLEGFHDVPASLAYHQTIHLAAKPGQTLTLTMTLVGGTTFKLLSLMLCSR